MQSRGSRFSAPDRGGGGEGRQGACLGVTPSRTVVPGEGVCVTILPSRLFRSIRSSWNYFFVNLVTTPPPALGRTESWGDTLV